MSTLRISTLLLLFSTTLLTAQDIRNSWNRSFAIPGVEDHVLAIGVEGDEIALRTYDGILIFRNSAWQKKIPLDYFATRADAWYPVRNLALYNGEPWVIGDRGIFRYNGVDWIQMPEPPVNRAGVVGEFLAYEGDLYLVPSAHRWNGTEWEATLPSCISSRVTVSARSTEGRWFIIGEDSLGCGVGEIALVDGEELTNVDLPEEPWLTGYEGVAFDGENPILGNYRYSNGSWEVLEGGESSGDHTRSIYPTTPGSPLYRIGPGWKVVMVMEDRWEPCENQLYRLDDDTWVPVSGMFDYQAHALEYRGTSGVVIGGEFSTDFEGFVADHVVAHDHASWVMIEEKTEPQLGVEGEVFDVEIDGDALWLGGRSLFVAGVSAGHALLRYEENSWMPVTGIAGEIDHLEMHEGDLFVAGRLTVGGEEALCARYDGSEWSRVSLPEIEKVSHMLSTTDGLYASGWMEERGEPDISQLYRIAGTQTERIIRDIDGMVQTFAFSGDTIYLGGDDGLLMSYRGNRLQRLPSSPSGGIRVWITDNLSSFLPASIHALLAYDGWLYVGGTFDSVAGMRVGNIARFDGTTWERLDSGVVLFSSGYRLDCGPWVIAMDRVEHLHAVGGRILVGGMFRKISTFYQLGSNRLAGGDDVQVPLALYNPATDTWEPAAPNEVRPDRYRSVYGLDVDDGRIAIAGEFTLPGVDGRPDSRNVAVTDRILTVENRVDRTINSTSLTFDLHSSESTLFLRSELAESMTIDLHDMSGRHLARLHEGRVTTGDLSLALPSDLPTGSNMVSATDQSGNQTSLRIER